MAPEQERTGFRDGEVLHGDSSYMSRNPAAKSSFDHNFESTEAIKTEPYSDAMVETSKGEGLGSEVPKGADPADFPDGGLAPWTVVLGGWCCQFCSFGWIACIGVFQNYYEQNQLRNYSPSVVAWIPSLETFMMFLGGTFFGKWFDNFGPRYLLLYGTFFHVFGLMMVSLSTQYYQFILAQSICSALGASAIFFAANNSISTWFQKNRALAIGVASSGSSMGGVVFP